MRSACSTASGDRSKSSCPSCATDTSFPIPTSARELALSNPDAFFLSQSGECFHNVTVTGGKQRAEGPLSMKRELRDVMRLLNELESALRNDEVRVLDLGPRDQGTHFPTRPAGRQKSAKPKLRR